jgi:hypothetical protein
VVVATPQVVVENSRETVMKAFLGRSAKVRLPRTTDAPVSPLEAAVRFPFALERCFGINSQT